MTAAWARRLIVASAISLACATWLNTNVGATLYPGDKIVAGGGCAYSPSGTYCLDIDRVFGLMLWNNGSWCNGTRYNWVPLADGSHACVGGYGTHTNSLGGQTNHSEADMQGDGNFVFYDSPMPGGTALWHTHTDGHTNNPFLEPQDDGNLVVYENGTPIWSIF